jgi:hypothetical protein
MPTTRDRRELAKFLEDVAAHLKRCSDPEATRLRRLLAGDGTEKVVRSEPENAAVYLGADSEDSGGGFKLDLAGHLIANYEGAGEHCLRCTALLIEAGDLSADWPAGSFAPDERHRRIQQHIVNHPGVTYLAAVRALEQQED